MTWPETRSLLENRYLHAVALVAVCFLVYANNYEHDYHLDSAYTVRDNPAVRDLGNVPRYFVDPSTYTVLREQVDYRPVLQATYALDYRMGGYESPWWHFTQILLHALVTLGLYAFARRFGRRSGLGRVPLAAFLAALVFAVHPAASGVVNYLNARSSLLAAAFLVPAIALYMDAIEEPDYERTAWGAAVFYALALFTKVEAVGALGVLLAYEAWQRARLRPDGGSFFGDLLRSFDRRSLKRAWPFLAITAIYTVVRLVVMAPYEFAEARHAADVGGYEYLLTQLTAWWFYIFRWVAPVHLVADFASYPVFRSPTRPEVLLALGGWVSVATALVVRWKRIPHLVFLAIAALALLAPTSSIAPLAEMVNEHRPYLAIGILWTGVAVSLGPLVRRRISAHRPEAWGYGTALAIVTIALATFTVERNRVFRSDLTYWADVVEKAPSARAHLNYGLAQMRRNDLDAAEDHFERALERAPTWYIAHLNMGVLHQRRGDVDRAAWHFDRAVETDRFSGMALAYRGELRLERGHWAGALDDFRRAREKSLERYRIARGLATAYAGLGRPEEALAEVDRLLSLDPGRAPFDIPEVSRPFYEDPELHDEGMRFYGRLAERMPDTWWVYENLARLAEMSGQEDLARSARARAESLRGGAATDG